MLVSPDRWTEAILFTTISYAVPLILAWWLFSSRMAGPARPAATPSAGEASWIGGLLGLSGLQLLVGAHWDAAMHIFTGKIPAGTDFLWPPHIMIYSSFLISLAIATFSTITVARVGWARGDRDPRRWVRSNPALGAVAVASLYSLLAVPGDAIWHEIFGPDLTAWSPPHVMLMLTAVVVVLSGAGMLVKVADRLPRKGLVRALVYIMLAVALETSLMVGVSEWELGTVRSLFVQARPIWLYPVISGALGFLFMMVARRMTGFRWGATVVALIDMLLWAGISGGLSLVSLPVPMMPLLFLGGAVLADMALNTSVKGREFWAAAAYAAGFLAAALPRILTRLDLQFSAADDVLTVVGVLIACLLLVPVARWFGGALGGAAVPAANAPRH